MPKETPVITGDKNVDRKLHNLITLLDRIRAGKAEKQDYLVALFLTHRIKKATHRSKEIDREYVGIIYDTMESTYTELVVQYALFLKVSGDPLKDILGPLLPE